MSYRDRYRLRRKMGYSPEKARKMAKSGCYIATAVYGSYDCPEVWTLRRYRDNKLAKTWYGRMFIHVYYMVSPIIVAIFGKKTWFKRIWKNALDKMVVTLGKMGYDSAPYQDKEW